MLIDKYLPTYDVSNKYAVTVNASPERVFQAVRRLDITSASLSMLLFRLRGISEAWAEEKKYDLDSFLKTGFVVLGEDPSQEFVLGLIGKPWMPAGDLVDFTAKEFAGFDKPGYSKIAWNFTVRPLDEGKSLLETETRILNTDSSSKWTFGVYWFFVGSLSGLTRKEILEVIKHQAETPLLPENEEKKEEQEEEGKDRPDGKE